MPMLPPPRWSFAARSSSTRRSSDDRGRRLVFFGRHAGLAGMLDTLAALGRRLMWEGIDSPFSVAFVRPRLHRPRSGARRRLRAWPTGSAATAFPTALHPVVFGFTGSGNASKGAQEIFELLPTKRSFRTISPRCSRTTTCPGTSLYKVVFTRRDRFGSAMASCLRHLTVLVNGIYWEPGHPRVVGLDDLRAYSARTPNRACASSATSRATSTARSRRTSRSRRRGSRLRVRRRLRRGRSAASRGAAR